LYTNLLQKYQIASKEYDKKIGKYDKTKVSNKTQFCPIGMVFRDINGAYYRDYLEALLVEKGFSYYQN